MAQETATPIKTISKTIGQVTELTCICPLKPGAAVSLRQVLGALQISPNSPIKEINTIHFARWVIFDNDTRLLFTSNFDGSWEDYLRDFSVKTPEGMDKIFGHCEGYPPGGCADFEAFKAYVHSAGADRPLLRGLSRDVGEGRARSGAREGPDRRIPAQARIGAGYSIASDTTWRPSRPAAGVDRNGAR